LNAAKEAKRKKAQEVLKLPENQRSGVEAVVNRERELLRIVLEKKFKTKNLFSKKLF
jgi:hypothetical protein